MIQQFFGTLTSNFPTFSHFDVRTPSAVHQTALVQLGAVHRIAGGNLAMACNDSSDDECWASKVGAGEERKRSSYEARTLPSSPKKINWSPPKHGIHRVRVGRAWHGLPVEHDFPNSFIFWKGWKQLKVPTTMASALSGSHTHTDDCS